MVVLITVMVTDRGVHAMIDAANILQWPSSADETSGDENQRVAR